MGVPVITLAGDRHAGRVGASILTHVGLSEFIAGDLDRYVNTAVQLAKNTDCLKAVRQGLRESLPGTALCNENEFARAIEQAYQNIWNDCTDRATA